MVLVVTTKTILPSSASDDTPDPCGIKDACLNINIQTNDSWTAFHDACFNGNTKLISLFLNSERLVGFANRKNLNLQSIQEYYEYPIGSTGYDILKSKNINIDVIKGKISKKE